MRTGSSGVGLNLQIATTVILFESDFNSAGDVETLDLVTRHALHNVKIVRLVTCSMAPLRTKHREMCYRVYTSAEVLLRILVIP